MSSILLPIDGLRDSKVEAGGRFMTYQGSRGDIEPNYYVDADKKPGGWCVSLQCTNYKEPTPTRVFVPFSVCRAKHSAIEVAIKVLELGLEEQYRTKLSPITLPCRS